MKTLAYCLTQQPPGMGGQAAPRSLHLGGDPNPQVRSPRYFYPSPSATLCSSPEYS